MALWTGKTGKCYWVYQHGPTDWAPYVSFVRDAMRSADPGDMMLTVPVDPDRPDPEQRRALSEAFQAGYGRAGLAFHAFATNSLIAYGVYTAIGWITPTPPWTQRAFRDLTEAIAWLQELAPGFERTALLADLRRAVPEESRWRPHL